MFYIIGCQTCHVEKEIENAKEEEQKTQIDKPLKYKNVDSYSDPELCDRNKEDSDIQSNIYVESIDGSSNKMNITSERQYRDKTSAGVDDDSSLKQSCSNVFKQINKHSEIKNVDSDSDTELCAKYIEGISDPSDNTNITLERHCSDKTRNKEDSDIHSNIYVESIDGSSNKMNITSERQYRDKTSASVDDYSSQKPSCSNVFKRINKHLESKNVDSDSDTELRAKYIEGISDPSDNTNITLERHCSDKTSAGVDDYSSQKPSCSNVFMQINKHSESKNVDSVSDTELCAKYIEGISDPSDNTNITLERHCSDKSSASVDDYSSQKPSCSNVFMQINKHSESKNVDSDSDTELCAKYIEGISDPSDNTNITLERHCSDKTSASVDDYSSQKPSCSNVFTRINKHSETKKIELYDKYIEGVLDPSDNTNITLERHCSDETDDSSQKPNCSNVFMQINRHLESKNIDSDSDTEISDKLDEDHRQIRSDNYFSLTHNNTDNLCKSKQCISKNKKPRKAGKKKSSTPAARKKDRERKQLERAQKKFQSASMDSNEKKNQAFIPQTLQQNANQSDHSIRNLQERKLEIRREKYKTMYRQDFLFREKKKAAARKHYQESAEVTTYACSPKKESNLSYRTHKILSGVNKYATDSEYRERLKEASKRQYHIDPKHKAQLKTASKNKYATDLQHQENVKQASKGKYASNIQHQKNVKQASKRKYSTDMQHQQNKKQASKRKYATDMQHQENIKQASKRKYATDMHHQQNRKQASKRKYATDMQHQQKKRQASKRKYATDMQHQQNTRQASKMKYATDLLHQQSVKVASKMKYATDMQHQRSVKEASKRKYAADKDNIKAAKKLKYATDIHHRTTVKMLKRLKYTRNPNERKRQLAAKHRRYMSDAAMRQRTKLAVIQKRKQIKANMNTLHVFRNEIKKKPKYVCSVCQKFLWRKQCLVCKPEHYIKKASDSGQMATMCITRKYLHACTGECEQECKIARSYRGKLWICYTCHRTLLRGKMPLESQINSLQLHDIPPELQNLNDIERHLLALRIPFMKLVSLPKGGQKGIMGPCVSVPTEVQKTTCTLPRCDTDAQLVRVKLKRKLPYKGHYKYQFVSTNRLKTAFEYLKKNNKWYKDITLDTSWENPIEESVHEISDEKISEEQCDINNGNNDDSQQNDCLASSDEGDTNEEKYDDNDRMNGAPVDTCLQPDDMGQEVLDQYFDDIFCVAPAENNTPVSMLKETGNEAMSFPCLFPNGISSFNDNRPVKLTKLRYFHNRLMHADGRFARDSTYIFYAQYLSELQQVVSGVSIALRKGTGLDQEGKAITANRISDSKSLRKLLQTDQGYKFLKPVRGTPPYWQVTMKDLFAMIRQKGIPTWFCTFSAADMRWAEIIDTILEQQGSTQKAEDLDWTQKCEVLASNPVMNAVMFNHRFSTFVKTVILSDSNPIGKVKNRFHRIEFQKRGSPHAHCTFWIEDAPTFDKDSDNKVCNFIDRYVTCRLPEESEDKELHEIVSSVQQHSQSHSKSCRKKGTTCRFNFPRPPSQKTFISRPTSLTDPSSLKSPEQLTNEAKQILKAVWDILLDPELDVNDITTQNLFEKAGITQAEYERASSIMTKRAAIVMKRSPADIWINQYNATLLTCWNANMDIQFILDAYSCVMYIISYISKAERELGMVLEETRKEAQEGNLDAEQTMKKIGSSYFHQREVCVQEAVYRVCGLHLKECSCNVQFIPVGENPVRMSIPLHVIQAKSKQPDQEIWMTSPSDKYKARPATSAFEFLCYASFFSEYRVLSPSQVPKNPKKTVHELQNDLGHIQKRTRSEPAVVRYPRFSKDKYPEQYYQAILQLFLPYRNETQLKPNEFNTYEEFYKSGAVKVTTESELTPVSSIVDNNRALFEKDADVLDDAKGMMEKAGPLEDAWASLASEVERERLESEMEANELNEIPDDASDDEIPELTAGQKTSGNMEITKSIFTTEHILPLMRSMNTKQKQVFYFVRQWCVDVMNGNSPAPFHLFLTGGAGTGKSHLVKCLFYEVQKILGPSVPSPDDIVALLTAPTGTAAYNIGGTTVHHAFSLSKYLTLPYKALRDESINSLRAKLQYLKILFIDEISMVDRKLLIYVSERLRQVKMSKSKELPFGNISVIAVGDFYQLPPVKQSSMLKKNAKDPVNLFTDYFQKVELDQVMRQRDDAEFASMLNRLRVRKKGDPLDHEDISKLEQCKQNYHESEALHVFPTNAEVEEHNFVMNRRVCVDFAFTITAHDFEKDLTTGKTTRIDTNYNPPQGSLPTELFIGIGARVMLMRNLDVSDGLVNGVFGTVERLVPNKEVDGLQQGLYVKFDDARVGCQLQNAQSGHSAVLIKPVVEELGRRNKLRHQFPLQAAWACTVHKVQGMTTDAITVSLGKVFSPGQAYVALSRCTTMDGLMIKDLDTDKIYCDDSVTKVISTMPKFSNNYTPNGEFGSVSIILHNIQGLYPHLKDLQSNNDIKQCQYLCLTETWLAQNDNLPDVDDFKLLSQPRCASYDNSSTTHKELKQQKHGGVGIYYRTGTDFSNVDLGLNNIEFLAFSITMLNLTVVVIYRPEKLPTGQFIQNLNKLIQELEKRHLPALLIGDFNENILKSPTPICKFLQQAGYKQLVTQPTTDGATLIDHAYSNSSLSIKASVIPTYYSYHNMISLQISNTESA